MKLEINSVKALTFSYCEFGSDSTREVSVTEWPSGEGFDVRVEGRIGPQAFSLSHEDAFALVAALNLAMLPKPKGE